MFFIPPLPFVVIYQDFNGREGQEGGGSERGGESVDILGVIELPFWGLRGSDKSTIDA